MTIVRRPSPFGELMSLRSAMDRLFEDSFVGRPFGGALGGTFDSTNQLPLDVTRTADALVVEAALPGIKPEDVDITVEDSTLTIRGEFRDERQSGEGESLVSEIRRGSFGRTITLPSGLEADKATATFENGVLTLRIPKAESVKPRQIRISPSIDGASSATRPSGSAEATPVAATGNGSKAEPAMSGQKG